MKYVGLEHRMKAFLNSKECPGWTLLFSLHWVMNIRRQRKSERRRERVRHSERNWKKKERQKALCHSATVIVVPTAYGSVLKYVFGCFRTIWNRQFPERPNLPKESTTLRFYGKRKFGSRLGSGRGKWKRKKGGSGRGRFPTQRGSGLAMRCLPQPGLEATSMLPE